MNIKTTLLALAAAAAFLGAAIVGVPTGGQKHTHAFDRLPWASAK